jgi:3-hydroxyacyl-[acyl-carrier-protein] dehydratase
MDELNIEQIQKILPQRYPFLLIDKVVEIKPGERVVAIKNITMTESFFQGHFPKQPIMPGTLIIEAMAQASIVLYYTKYKDNLEKTPDYYLGSVKAKFKHPVVPGDQLRIEAKTVKVLPQGAFIEAKALVGDAEIAEAELVFAVKR